MKKILITIDGPAGAGKTTVSRMLADRLGIQYVDTGALYRTVAYEAAQRQIRSDDDDALEKLCGDLNIQFISGENGLRIASNGIDISDYIRTPEITRAASAVSARPVVREFLLGLQRRMGKQRSTVFEGRDMGTVVFPDADVKFFLCADSRLRAVRRYNEIKSNTVITLKEVERDICRRDRDDSNRKLAPLKPAQDAIVIDSTDLTVEQVVERMASFIKPD